MLKGLHHSFKALGGMLRSKTNISDVVSGKTKAEMDTAAGTSALGAGTTAICFTFSLWKPLGWAFKLSDLKWLCKIGIYLILLVLNGIFT